MPILSMLFQGMELHKGIQPLGSGTNRPQEKDLNWTLLWQGLASTEHLTATTHMEREPNQPHSRGKPKEPILSILFQGMEPHKLNQPLGGGMKL